MTQSDSIKDPVHSQRFEMALKIVQGLEELQRAAPQKRAERVYNLLMEAERALHLDHHPEDKANGLYARSLGTPTFDRKFCRLLLPAILQSVSSCCKPS